jgi:hypothetical protein
MSTITAMRHPLLNLAIAYVNMLAAIYWCVMLEPGAVAFSCAGAMCSLKAVEWMRE